MLGKLLKYDFLAVGKRLFPIYAALFISVIGLNINIAVYHGMSFGLLGGIFAFLFTLSVMAVFIGTVVVLIRHFYTSLFSDQGYLTFVLPVGEGTQLVSKLLNGAIYSVISVIVVFFASILTASNSLTFDTLGVLFRQIGEFLQAISQLGLDGAYILFTLIVSLILSLFSGQVMVYFCIILGQLWGKHRVLGAVLAGVGLYVVNVIIFSFLATSAITPLMYLNDANVLTAEGLGIIINYGKVMTNYAMAITTIETVAAYIASWFILKKHTNIE